MINEIIKFMNDDFQLDVTVSPNEETVWLTQKKWRNYLMLSHKQLLDI